MFDKCQKQSSVLSCDTSYFIIYPQFLLLQLFKTLQGNIFTLDQKCKYLRLASDTSLIQAGVEAEKEKKRKMVQQTFVDQTTCTDWTEAKELYPAHTTEEMINKLAGKVHKDTTILRS